MCHVNRHVMSWQSRDHPPLSRQLLAGEGAYEVQFSRIDCIVSGRRSP